LGERLLLRALLQDALKLSISKGHTERKKQATYRFFGLKSLVVLNPDALLMRKFLLLPARLAGFAAPG
jgi:hypothetical protein